MSWLLSIPGLLGLCILGFQATASVAATAPSFCKEVAPILFAHCLGCHRPGEIASTASFQSYAAARPWAKAIKEKVLTREMPPWPADANGSVKFRNDSRLSQREIDTLVAWVDGGASEGRLADLPPKPQFPQGWLHPKSPPDAVITLPEVELPAQGEIPYVTQLIKVPFAEDKWVTAIQVRPGNRAVVHHMGITEIAADEGFRPADAGPLTQLAHQLGLQNVLIGTQQAVTAPGHASRYDMLGIYTPGAEFEVYDEGSAKLLKGGKNFYINFNIHYQTTGKPERDRSRMALWFQPRPPEHQVFRVPAAADTVIAGGREILTDALGEKAEGTGAAIPPIPPNAGNFEVIGITAYTEPITIYQFHPHAHLRAKDFTYTVVYDDGREETVLRVPKYDFRWQLAYDLQMPLNLPAGSKLVVTAHYDNSVNNKNNPAPDKEVRFRGSQNQSWDEMFTPLIQYTSNSVSPVEAGERKALNVVEVGGCLESDPAGVWMLTRGSDPVISETQSTSSRALTSAGAKPLSNRPYKLLGASFFKPSSYKGNRVAVKGVLITSGNESQLNITSLQKVAATCAN